MTSRLNPEKNDSAMALESLPDQLLPLGLALSRPSRLDARTTAGATYLRIVLRSTPSDPDISFSDLPACQCTSISGHVDHVERPPCHRPPVPDGRQSCSFDGQVHHDTHAVMGNYVIELGKYAIVSPSELGNYKIADRLELTFRCLT
jgi:hypothetical protein